MVAFGLSRSLALSVAALFAAGLCDGTSVVIRRAILRLASPEAMRGRIAAVRSVFLSSSNELGAFESGVAASLVGAQAAVWGGGLVTLGVVAVVAWRAPGLIWRYYSRDRGKSDCSGVGDVYSRSAFVIAPSTAMSNVHKKILTGYDDGP